MSRVNPDQARQSGRALDAANVFPPAIAAVSLGIFGHAASTRRIGRNETFNHAGNAVAAGLAGVSAYWFGPTVVFYLLRYRCQMNSRQRD